MGHCGVHLALPDQLSLDEDVVAGVPDHCERGAHHDALRRRRAPRVHRTRAHEEAVVAAAQPAGGTGARRLYRRRRGGFCAGHTDQIREPQAILLM